jgi:hypothetical protein
MKEQVQDGWLDSKKEKNTMVKKNKNKDTQRIGNTGNS